MKTKLITLLILTLILQSCGLGTNPEDTFAKTAHITNLYNGFGSKDFERFKSLKPLNMLSFQTENGEWGQQDKIEPHITTYIIPNIEKGIAEIKALSPTSDTEAMIKRSLILHEFILEKHKTDYITIAKLIDSNAPKEEIDHAIAAFDAENFEKYWALHTDLMDVALPYAETNGINVTSY